MGTTTIMVVIIFILVIGAIDVSVTVPFMFVGGHAHWCSVICHLCWVGVVSGAR